MIFNDFLWMFFMLFRRLLLRKSSQRIVPLHVAEGGYTSLDPPSLIQPGPDSKFEDTLLDVTLRRFFSLHVASLRLTSLLFIFFASECEFF